jgi:hypothetical protein
MRADFIAEAAAHFNVYEGRTWTTSTGTQISVYNRRRDSTTTTTVLEDTTGTFVDSNALVKNPSVLAAGTLLHSSYTWVSFIGHQHIAMPLLVLNPNTTYSFEMVGDAGLASSHIRLSWYEKIDGE